jgi:hypothetical protein
MKRPWNGGLNGELSRGRVFGEIQMPPRDVYSSSALQRKEVNDSKRAT